MQVASHVTIAAGLFIGLGGWLFGETRAILFAVLVIAVGIAISGPSHNNQRDS